MGAHASLNRKISLWHIGTCLSASMGWASPAWAITSDLICGEPPETPVAAAPRYARAEDLRRATQAIEARTLRSASALDMTDAFAALDVTLDSSQVADASAQAEYCTAAGEVMRHSPKGSQYQAQTYLLNGYRLAALSGADQTAALAAFRLGLVSSSGSPVAGARSGSRSARRNVGVKAAGLAIPRTLEALGCSGLGDANLLAHKNGEIAEAALACASSRAAAQNEPQLAALAGLRLARLRLGLAETEGVKGNDTRARALGDVLAVLPVASTVSDDPLRAELSGRLVSAALDLGARPGAELQTAVATLRAAARDDPGSLAYADAIDARLALLGGDRPRAMSLLSSAILRESQRALPARLPEYYLLLAQADPERRDQHAFAAYTALNNIRPLLPRTDPLTEESTFALQMRSVFETAVDSELAAAELANETDRIDKAQEIIEDYRQAELESVLGSECLPVRNALRPEQLRADEVLLYPILLPDRVELLFVAGSDTPGGKVRYQRLAPNRSANRESVTQLVKLVVDSLSDDRIDDDWREPARELYDILIAPIEDKLRPGSMLAIIPDGQLRALPFAALPAADGQYLIQKTRLSVAPALAYSQPGGPNRSKTVSIVAASLELAVNLPAGKFAALTGTAKEARIASDSSRGGLFIGDFKKAQLEAALSSRPVDVLHLATHASFNGRSDRAFVVANGETIPLSELRDLISKNRARGDELALLVLSACETAVGDDEASMGLAGAAVQAGAMSAIASLWQVDDAGTGELMKQFYARYSVGGARSQSLREAQLALLDGGGANADPFVWAAFTLLGAWR